MTATATPTPIATTPALDLGDASPRAWRRYLARMIDLTLGYFVAGYAIAIVLPALAAMLTRADNNLGWYLAGTAVLIPLEGFLLSVFRMTPGKALLGLRVTRHDGTSLPFGAAVGRSAHVWFAGLALGVPLVALFVMARAKTRLETTRTTSWDEAAGSTVRYMRDISA